MRGYYDPLLGVIAQAVEQGFMSAPQGAVLRVGTDARDLLQVLSTLLPPRRAADDYGAI